MKKLVVAFLLASSGALLLGCPDKAAESKPDPAASAKPAAAAASASAAPKAGGGW